MTKEEVLQKVNDYCTEKQYTTATLTDSFKDKFADHFQKANPDGDVNDENVLKSLKFALNTAFSSASELATVKTTEFTSKENDYKSQISALNEKLQTIAQPQQKPRAPQALPEEVQNQLKELQAFKDAKTKQEKLGNILRLAKQGIREDLHASFDKYAKEYDVKLDKEDKEQADGLAAHFKEIFKDSLGDIRPQKPTTDVRKDEEIIGAMPKVKISN